MKQKLKHIRDDPTVLQSDVICFSETWLSCDQKDESLELDGFKLHTNSIGRGKGLATYFKEDKFVHTCDIKRPTFQLTKIASDTVDIISVYSSSGAKLEELSAELLIIFNPSKTTVICGDLNVCYNSQRNNRVTTILETHGFEQLVKEATHLQGGLIDHVYFHQVNDIFKPEVSIYSPYYCATDHDAILLHLDFQNYSTI